MSENNIISIANAADFDELKKKNQLIVVKFFAAWCGPCRTMKPIMSEVASNNPDVIFCDINVDEAQSIAQLYHIKGIPVVLFIKNDKVLDTITGLVPGSKIQNAIDNAKNA